ncbi:outer membrane lipoprotein carrier protein LolA [Bradyrhizobium sp.]|jgi:outer membrane lipoprotein-sorting protein|uniref:outer membrane lipoprotein carrier protein LolA n=1 Tax=Bradyrhizobium sp. TaxID=376 RepID=UPI003C23396D
MASRFSLSFKRVAFARAAFAVTAAFGVVSTSAVAQAPIPPQSIPVPKAAPKGREGVTDLQKGPTTAGATQVAPNPVIPDPHRNVPLSIFATFDDKQKAQAAKISTYLSSLQTLIGNFVQVGPDGSKTKGQFFIQKPGKVRFEYETPNPIAIVADGSMVAIRDRNLSTQDLYPLSQTPLRYLLSDRIDLMKDTNVVSVTADDLFISVTIEERQLLTGTSRLMLMVGAKDGQLKQWTVTDPQGYDTTVAVYNLDTSRKIDPGMFKIDMTDRTFPPG